MTRPALYIAAPYGDPSPTIRAWHTDRAALLCRLATLSGYSAVCVHPTIAAGGYGDDSDPAQRAAGMEATLDLCRLVLRSYGAWCWALCRDDGTLSTGAKAEYDAALEAIVPRRAMTWDEWRTFASAFPALLPEWDRLATRPDAVGEWAPLTDGSVVIGRLFATGRVAAVSQSWAWFAYDALGTKIGQGPETGEAGRAAADAALRAAGVMR